MRVVSLATHVSEDTCGAKRVAFGYTTSEDTCVARAVLPNLKKIKARSETSLFCVAKSHLPNSPKVSRASESRLREEEIFVNFYFIVYYCL